MKRRFVISAALSLATLVAGGSTALAGPNPNPQAPAHTSTACENVLSRNPNTGPGAHQSATGGANFSAVGAAMCGL